MKKKYSLLLTGIVLALALLGCANTSPQLVESQPDSSSTPIPLDVSRIGVEESKVAFDNGEALFLDVRSESSYAANHIPGALSIPLVELQTRMEEFDPNQWIITYCTWPNEESSARAAEILLKNGFTRVNPILGGLNAWKDAGYPIESSQ